MPPKRRPGTHIQYAGDEIMLQLLHGILADHQNGGLFTCFGIWHFCYIIGAGLVIALLMVLLRKKETAVRMKTAGFFSDLAFGLYMADFFLMPLAYGEIDIEKLPFHICTAMCLMCFLSRHVRFLEKYRIHFTLLGFLSNLVYLIYPAGVMWHRVSPFTYRVIQTLIFHAVMTVYGFLVLSYDPKGVSYKTCFRDLLVLVGMTLWAVLGNLCYNGAFENYDHFFNWFFVMQDPFGLFDRSIAPFFMPVLNIALFFGVELGLIGLFSQIRKRTAEPPKNG